MDTADARRLRVGRWAKNRPAADAEGGPACLGLLRYGACGASSADSGFAPIQADVLQGEDLAAMAWQGGTPAQAGATGMVRWHRDEHWLFGAIDLDESAHPEDLAGLTRRAYRDLFDTLAQAGRPHLLRIWNYLPHINAEGDGLERYRQFNLGRQQAFLDAGQAAFDGAPSACALGTRRGPLSIRFLAGCAAPVPVENPRQVSAYRYPSNYGPRAPTFSRAALADAGGGQLALLVSGTASIVGHESVHPGDVEAQTRETLRNLQAVIDAAEGKHSARFDLRELDCIVYLRRAADIDAVRRVLRDALGAQAHAVRNALYLEADICRGDLLVEIEAQAFAAGQLRTPSRAG